MSFKFFSYSLEMFCFCSKQIFKYLIVIVGHHFLQIALLFRLRRFQLLVVPRATHRWCKSLCSHLVGWAVVGSVMATKNGELHVEDTIEYFIYPSLSPNRSLADQLDELRVECFTALMQRSRSYIWHEESVQLDIVLTRGKSKGK